MYVMRSARSASRNPCERKKKRCAGAALRIQIGVAAVPFERSRIGDIFDGTVIDDIHAETIRLQVPLQSIEGRIEMAVGTTELALKREF